MISTRREPSRARVASSKTNGLCGSDGMVYSVLMSYAAKGRSLLPVGTLFGRSCLGLFGLRRTQQRKKDHVTDRLRARQQHRHAVNADALATRRRHAVRKCADVIFIHSVRLFVAA